jgi:hypothetical protein
MGTPPRPVDPGEAFTNKRRKALANKAKDVGAGFGDMVYVELSADPTADPDDRSQVMLANPSVPKRTPWDSIARLRENVGSDESFLREGLGVWDDDAALATIPPRAWADRADRSEDPAPHVGRIWLAIDADPDRARTSIVACGARENGKPLVEVTSTEAGVVDNHPGVEWALVRAVEIHRRNPISAVLVVTSAAAGSLIKGLTDAKLPVVPVTEQQYKQACGQFYDAVVETGQVEHLAQRVLDDAVKIAIKRPSGDAWVWDRKRAGDITPVTGGTLARYGWALKLGTKRNAGKGRVVALA